MGASAGAREQRYVLYVPRTGESYTLSAGAGEGGSARLKWSANAMSDAAQPFRAALKRVASAAPDRTL